MNKFIRLLVREKLYLTIPENEPVSRQQFALFRIFSFVGTIVCAGVATKMLFTIKDVGALPYLIIGLGLTILLNFYLVKSVAKLKGSYLIMLLSAFTLLHIVSYSCGGIRTAGTFYFAAVILYAYMLLGRSIGKYFTYAVIFHIIYLYFITTYTNLTSFNFFKNDVLLINEDFVLNAIMTVLLIAAQGNYLQSGKNEVIQDVNKKKAELEKKNEILEQNNLLLNHYANSLEKTNSELRKFASVASHDLKAPLRAIGSLAGFIEDEEMGKLKPESLIFMDTLKKRVCRMDNLLNALLEYSTIGETVDDVDEIDSATLISDIAEQFAINDSVQIGMSGDFPILYGNRFLINKVFFNLMENAIKFNSKSEKNVKISFELKDDNYWFSVEDNGPGIDIKFHERIFIIFQTLNPRDEVETMGVGLPIVKKIVESWNGEIQIVSSQGEGALFSFSIPVKKIFNPVMSYSEIKSKTSR